MCIRDSTQGDWRDKHHVEPIEIAGYSLMAAGVKYLLHKLQKKITNV